MQYDVPIMKVQTYSLGDIFEKGLLMLKIGKLTVEEIAEYTELSIAEVEQLAGLQTM